MYSIYTLIDPRDNLIHYVGISKNAQVRFLQHIRKDHNWVKSAWIRELKEAKLLPIMDIIAEDLTCEDAQEQEQKLIQHYYNLGLPLVNFNGIKRQYAKAKMEGRKKRKRWGPPLWIATTVEETEELLTSEEISAEMNLPKDKVRDLIKTGQLEGMKIGNQWRVTRAALNDYINRHKQPQPGTEQK